jgi:hypothetical protein
VQKVVLGLVYGQKIDLWSLGCILAELSTGYLLFRATCGAGGLRPLISSPQCVLLHNTSFPAEQCAGDGAGAAGGHPWATAQLDDQPGALHLDI